MTPSDTFSVEIWTMTANRVESVWLRKIIKNTAQIGRGVYFDIGLVLSAAPAAPGTDS